MGITKDVAAACIFLATKTEECGRKLRDVARVYHAKVVGADVSHIPLESKEVEQCQAAILLTEEVLLEALCFDFVVESPHAELLELFESSEGNLQIQEYAWSLAHDSYRTPVCILYPQKIIATACFVLAQRIIEGPNSPSLDARISASAPSNSLPTPPSHKPPSPDATRYAIDHFLFNEIELSAVSETLSILLEFYSAQDEETYPYLSSIIAVPPPMTNSTRPILFVPPDQITAISSNLPPPDAGRTPSSSHGGRTPAAGASESNFL